MPDAAPMDQPGPTPAQRAVWAAVDQFGAMGVVLTVLEHPDVMVVEDLLDGAAMRWEQRVSAQQADQAPAAPDPGPAVTVRTDLPSCWPSDDLEHLVAQQRRAQRRAQPEPTPAPGGQTLQVQVDHAHGDTYVVRLGDAPVVYWNTEQVRAAGLALPEPALVVELRLPESAAREHAAGDRTGTAAGVALANACRARLAELDAAAEFDRFEGPTDG